VYYPISTRGSPTQPIQEEEEEVEEEVEVDVEEEGEVEVVEVEVVEEVVVEVEVVMVMEVEVVVVGCTLYGYRKSANIAWRYEKQFKAKGDRYCSGPPVCRVLQVLSRCHCTSRLTVQPGYMSGMRPVDC